MSALFSCATRRARRAATTLAMAGIWSFKARDYVASSLLTMWGTFWMGWAVLEVLGATHAVTIPPLTTPQPGYALRFIPLGTFTFLGSVAALSKRHRQPAAVASAVHGRRRLVAFLHRTVDG